VCHVRSSYSGCRPTLCGIADCGCHFRPWFTRFDIFAVIYFAFGRDSRPSNVGPSKGVTVVAVRQLSQRHARWQMKVAVSYAFVDSCVKISAQCIFSDTKTAEPKKLWRAWASTSCSELHDSDISKRWFN